MPDPSTLDYIKKAKTRDEAANFVYYGNPGYTMDEVYKVVDRIAEQEGKIWEKSSEPEDKGPLPNFLDRMKGSVQGATFPDMAKTLGDFGVGAVPGITTGAGWGLPGAIAGGLISGGVNTFLNKDEPFLSPNNFSNMLAGPLGEGSRIMMAGRGVLPKVLLKTAENLGVNVGGRKLGEVAGNPSNVDPKVELALSAGLPLIGGTIEGLASRKVQQTPGVWQRLMHDMTPAESPENVEKAFSKIYQQSKEATPGINLLEGLNKADGPQAQLTKATVLNQEAEKVFNNTMSRARYIRDKIQSIVDERVQRGIGIGEDILETKKSISDANKVLQELKAQIPEGDRIIESGRVTNREKKYLDELTRDDVLGQFEKEKYNADKAADLYQQIGEVQNDKEDLIKLHAQQTNEQKLTKVKSQEEQHWINQGRDITSEVTAARAEHNRLSRMIRDKQYDVDEVNKAIEAEIKRTGFDPRAIAPETRELLTSMAKESPETVVRNTMKTITSKGKETLENLINFTAGDKKTQDGIRTALARELISPTDLFYHGSQTKIANEGGDIMARFMNNLQELGQDSINNIFGSPTAYENLKSYGKLLQYAQRNFPASMWQGSVARMATIGGGGGFALPMIFKGGFSPESAAVGLTGGLMGYAYVQAPVFINNLVRMSPTMTKLLTSMAKNPEKFMSGSFSSRVLMAYLRKNSEHIVVSRGPSQKPLVIKTQPQKP